MIAGNLLGPDEMAGYQPYSTGQKVESDSAPWDAGDHEVRVTIWNFLTAIFDEVVA